MADIIDNTRFEKVRAAAASGMPGCRNKQKIVKAATTRGLQAAVKREYEAPASRKIGQFPNVETLDQHRPCDLCSNPRELSTSDRLFLCRECAAEVDAEVKRFLEHGVMPANEDYRDGSAGYWYGDNPQFQSISPKSKWFLFGALTVIGLAGFGCLIWAAADAIGRAV